MRRNRILGWEGRRRWGSVVAGQQGGGIAVGGRVPGGRLVGSCQPWDE